MPTFLSEGVAPLRPHDPCLPWWSPVEARAISLRPANDRIAVAQRTQGVDHHRSVIRKGDRSSKGLVFRTGISQDPEGLIQCAVHGAPLHSASLPYSEQSNHHRAHRA